MVRFRVALASGVSNNPEGLAAPLDEKRPPGRTMRSPATPVPEHFAIPPNVFPEKGLGCVLGHVHDYVESSLHARLPIPISNSRERLPEFLTATFSRLIIERVRRRLCAIVAGRVSGLVSL